MAQPGERLLLELSHPLAAEAQLLSQLIQRAQRLHSKTISSNDDPAHLFGKLIDQIVQGMDDHLPLQCFHWIG